MKIISLNLTEKEVAKALIMHSENKEKVGDYNLIPIAKTKREYKSGDHWAGTDVSEFIGEITKHKYPYEEADKMEMFCLHHFGEDVNLLYKTNGELCDVRGIILFEK